MKRDLIDVIESALDLTDKKIIQFDDLKQSEQDLITVTAVTGLDGRIYDFICDEPTFAPLLQGFLCQTEVRGKAQALREFILKRFGAAIKKDINYFIGEIKARNAIFSFRGAQC